MAFDCDIPREMRFDRKNYYYPDLPKNYQISQNYTCLGSNGYVEIETKAGRKRIRLDNIHLEEDAGKLVHPEGSGADYSLVDLNRTGTPLLEIVTKPDMSDLEEVEAYMETLRRTLEALSRSPTSRCRRGASGSKRAFPSSPKALAQLGNRVEVKNLNSTRAVLNSLEYEIVRQAEVLDGGGRIDRETRLWNEAAGRTERMRSKEEAQDYRYFPEPDLGPVRDARRMARRDARARLRNCRTAASGASRTSTAYPRTTPGVLTQKRSIADYFEAIIAAGRAGAARTKSSLAKMRLQLGHGRPSSRRSTTARSRCATSPSRRSASPSSSP